MTYDGRYPEPPYPTECEECERMRAEAKEMQEIAQYLYGLLDDIDTASDVAKSDDKLYRRIVERTQAKKARVVAACDGYTVTLRPLMDGEGEEK